MKPELLVLSESRRIGDPASTTSDQIKLTSADPTSESFGGRQTASAVHGDAGTQVSVGYISFYPTKLSKAAMLDLEDKGVSRVLNDEAAPGTRAVTITSGLMQSRTYTCDVDEITRP